MIRCEVRRKSEDGGNDSLIVLKMLPTLRALKNVEFMFFLFLPCTDYDIGDNCQSFYR